MVQCDDSLALAFVSRPLLFWLVTDNPTVDGREIQVAPIGSEAIVYRGRLQPVFGLLGAILSRDSPQPDIPAGYFRRKVEDVAWPSHEKRSASQEHSTWVEGDRF